MPYVGETNTHGKAHGQGTWTNSDSSAYTGGFKDGKGYGSGVFTGSNGGSFVGTWKDDQLHGTFVVTTRYGVVYDAVWDNNRQVSTIQRVSYLHATYFLPLIIVS